MQEGQKKGGTLQKKIVALFSQVPKKLWTYPDLCTEMSIDERASQNGLYNAHRLGKIKRHIDKSMDGYWRYGLDIPADKESPYATVYAGRDSKKPKKGKKAQLPTARELRTMFAQMQNIMAQVEDTVLLVVDEFEELEKTMNKIKNII